MNVGTAAVDLVEQVADVGEEGAAAVSCPIGTAAGTTIAAPLPLFVWLTLLPRF